MKFPVSNLSSRSVFGITLISRVPSVIPKNGNVVTVEVNVAITELVPFSRMSPSVPTILVEPPD